MGAPCGLRRFFFVARSSSSGDEALPGHHRAIFIEGQA